MKEMRDRRERERRRKEEDLGGLGLWWSVGEKKEG